MYVNIMENNNNPRSPPASCWVRDVHEEGIEPHPGPPQWHGFLSKNIDGLNDRFGNTMHLISVEHKARPIRAIFIQEHHIKKAKAEELNVSAAAGAHGLLYFQAHLPDAESKGGTALVIPIDTLEKKGKELEHQAIKRVTDSVERRPDGRMVSATILINGTETKLTSIYAPVTGPNHQDRDAFFEDVARSITPGTVIGMDANCHLAPIDYQSNAASQVDNTGAAELHDIIADNGLIDVTRESLGHDHTHFTNHTNTANGVTKRRLDLVLAPQVDAITWDLDLQRKDFLTMGRTFGHDMVSIKMCIIQDERGKDLQTINETIFEDSDFNRKLANAIKAIVLERNPATNGNWRDTWEEIKVMARDMCLEQTVALRKQQKIEATTAQTLLRYAEANIKAGLGTSKDYTDRDELRKKVRSEFHTRRSLHDMLEKEAYETGQKHDVNTAAFHRAWTPKNGAQWVHEAIRRDWSDPSKPQPLPPPGPHKEAKAEKIAEAFTDYYKSLFKKPPSSQQVDDAKRVALEALEEGGTVTEPTAERCGLPIALEEVRLTMTYLPDRKSPGPDRLPNAFYKTLNKVICPILTEVFNESHTHHSLPPSMLRGTISVLYKKSDRDDPRNYRPITLLNNDYKILMRILTKRMNEAVLQFVSNDQNGFVPDAFIAENIMRLQLLQAYIEEEEIEALFMFCDMEKAFDRCSWDFLIEGLEKLGFNRSFIDYVELAYSHGNPPKRQMYVNGYLGPEFPLGSGVAQGCPLSPLLFLVIAEPLTRMINDNPDIRGISVKANGQKMTHKISQFADDSALILRHRDVNEALNTIGIWCTATNMRENKGKREILPLGPLKDKPEEINPRLTRHGARVAKKGETIRALGAPLGNDFSITEWWQKKYATVKPRIAAWNGLSRLSLTGRNILLQSIFYGSFRYWFFFLTVPDEIIDMIEADAKALLWAAAPELQADEEGTTKRSKRYMRELVSYLPQKAGGGSIMHLPSHVKAFQAQWVIKYLDPREAPWKNLLDYWVVRDDHLGRGIVLSRNQLVKCQKRIPESCGYLRACFNAFAELDVRQDLSLLTHESQGEPLWRSNRFRSTMPPASINEWMNEMEVNRLSHLLDDSGFHTTREWDSIIFKSTPTDLSQAERNEWRRKRAQEVRTVRGDIPREMRDMFKEDLPEIENGQIVFAVDLATKEEMYARLTKNDQGDEELHEMRLDTSRYPHATGRIFDPTDHLVYHVAMWVAMNKHYVQPYLGDEDSEEPIERDAIIGPANDAFPLNDGWHAFDQSADVGKGAKARKRRQSDLTIHVMTIIFTNRLTKGERPTSETKWPEKWPHPLNFKWTHVWDSLGTPLSDPTEEKAWRRLLHRAIDAKNRHPLCPDKSCRLKCGENNESMLHMIQCPYVQPLWSACRDFCVNVLGNSMAIILIHTAIVFNVDKGGKLLDELTRAFLRHAVRWWYADLTAVHREGVIFNWQHCFLKALHGLRSAAIRWALAIRKHFIKREHTHLVEQVAEQTRERFAKIIAVDPTGRYSITSPFQSAIDSAQAAYDATVVQGS